MEGFEEGYEAREGRRRIKPNRAFRFPKDGQSSAGHLSADPTKIVGDCRRAEADARQAVEEEIKQAMEDRKVGRSAPLIPRLLALCFAQNSHRLLFRLTPLFACHGRLP